MQCDLYLYTHNNCFCYSDQSSFGWPQLLNKQFIKEDRQQAGYLIGTTAYLTQKKTIYMQL